ncbi:peptidase S8/S53 domain-containing protein [Rhizophagus clarus]|uniref:Peptidase S8/S53 domain-containing protein n=1 Tax=Rhizophagus clarus TaxID=94130 RepID=A0A8H3LZG2_9GLOM|nr:peptidase S8/S53 domain-containing protein [Rhizophagus clarus]
MRWIIKRFPKHIEIVENIYLLKFSITPSNKENITIRYEFHELINAITFEAKEDDLKSTVEIIGVQSIEPVQKHRIPPISSNMIKSKYTRIFDKRDWITNTPLNLTKGTN